MFARRCFKRSLPLLAFCLVAGIASAQDFPSKPLRFIVPNAAGTITDSAARTFAPGMAKALGQPIIVENRAGGGNNIGLEYVAKRVPADGYTFLIMNAVSTSILPVTDKDLQFDPLKDLPMLMGLAYGRLFFVSTKKQPWKSFDDFVAAAKASPGRLNYGTPAPVNTLMTEALLHNLNLKVASIPYSSSAASYTALLAGDIQVEFVNEQIAAQNQPLAVTGDKRAPAFMDVPTFTELGFPYMPSIRFTLNLPVGVPKPAFDKLYSAASQALREPEMNAQFAKLQLYLSDETAADATKTFLDNAKLFSDVAHQIGLKPQ